MQQDIYKQLIQVLKQDERLIVEGKLAKNKVIELALQLDSDLLKAIRSSKPLAKLFFQQVDDVAVFDKVKFQSFVSNKQFLPDSFTEYKNKIGLLSDKQYLTESQEVVLAFPYKDCVLEGGQTKDDAKRSEVFWNETLAPDEIDKLLEPKVLTNIRRYTENGVEIVKKIDSKDNLVIKGNNLLVLHSLKQVYSGKVKLIYIDPPYNTGTDSFGYNDKFNHSTWLTFMRNRLTVAKEFLIDNGFIVVQVDDNESAYLKVLMDEVFGRENYRNSIYWHRTYAGKTVSKNMPWNVDTLLLYSKKPNVNLQNITSELTEKDIASYTKDDKDGRGLYNTVSLQKTGSPGPQTSYNYIDNSGKIWKCPAKGWRMTKEKLKALENDNRLYINGNTIREKYYLNERMDIGKQIDNFWSDIGNMNRGSDMDYNLGGQKPEKLLERIISLTTLKGDLVLDYHLGSGTTSVVAHKMGRRFIGVEQLDYGDNDSVMRLQNVLKGDPTGISKTIDWKGGGSFVYAELSRANQIFVDKIQNSKNTKDLVKVWGEMKENAFLSYKVKPEDIDATKKDFESLAFEDQQKFLISILDKNLLYVPYSEIADKTYKISKEDKDLNNKFYSGK